MTKPVGGRGKQAPYQTTHVRIPEPLKARVEQLKEMFFTDSLEHHDELLARDARLAREYENLLTGKEEQVNSSQNSLPGLDIALDEARKILKSKKSTKIMISKLLTALYGLEVKPEELE